MQLDMSEYVLAELAERTFVTTAVMARSGCAAEGADDALGQQCEESGQHTECPEKVSPKSWAWLLGSEAPHSRYGAGKEAVIDSCLVLDTTGACAYVCRVRVTVVPGNAMRVLMGRRAARKLSAARQSDPSPMQQKSMEDCDAEIQDALLRVCDSLEEQRELTDQTRAAVSNMLQREFASVWRAKFDLDQASLLPPMKITLRPDAQPTKIRRHYHWTVEQREWLRQHLRKLVDVGVISRTQSEWCCPVVLVLKQDLTWRLCVDPNALNRVTVPIHWEIPRVREVLQSLLRDVRWFCQFDFVSMFWQIALEEQSRKLFSFYAGDLGTFCFNRVAMGALNSSVYTQRVITGLFENVTRKDGQPLLYHGLVALCDDILLYAKTQEEMREILHLFITTTARHRMALHPGKCSIFVTNTIYCGLKVGRAGITGRGSGPHARPPSGVAAQKPG